MSGVPALARLRVPRPTPGLFFRSGPRPAGLSHRVQSMVGPETTLLSPPLLCRLPRNLRPSLGRHGFGALAAALAPQLNGGGALLGGALELFSLFARGDLGHTNGIADHVERGACRLWSLWASTWLLLGGTPITSGRPRPQSPIRRRPPAPCKVMPEKNELAGLYRQERAEESPPDVVDGAWRRGRPDRHVAAGLVIRVRARRNFKLETRPKAGSVSG